jgi:hypothetical protein
MISVSVQHGRFDPKAFDFFPRERLGVFYCADVISAFFGDRWLSVLVTDGSGALLHWFVPRPIGTTGYYDIEPWFGYAGPICGGSWDHVNEDIMDAYSTACRERQIIAELIRFDPMMANHVPLLKSNRIEMAEGRLIAYASISHSNAEDQIRELSPPCRRQIAMANRTCRFARLQTASEWEEFQRLYSASLIRVRASKRWFFRPDVFSRLREIQSVALFGVSHCDKLVSASLVLWAGDLGHSLLVANVDLHKHKGANDLLMFGMIGELKVEGVRWLCLGGGRSGDASDSLLRFKQKFAKQVLALPIGFLCHDVDVYKDLCRQANVEDTVHEEMQPSTELIQRFMPYRTVASLADWGAISGYRPDEQSYSEEEFLMRAE